MKFNYKDYNYCLKILRKELNDSMIDFDMIEYDNSNTIEISYPYKNSTLAKYYEIELQKIGFETEFYKFVINEGSDVGPITSDKRQATRKSYFYTLNNTYEVWTDFDEEYSILKKYMADIVNNAHQC
tara:strand:+ start:1272 stop:1652 length:381 start_codon:yes stop_codon:yes gene_type:complete